MTAASDGASVDGWRNTVGSGTEGIVMSLRGGGAEMRGAGAGTGDSGGGGAGLELFTLGAETEFISLTLFCLGSLDTGRGWGCLEAAGAGGTGLGP